jgi:hypothetical protein
MKPLEQVKRCVMMRLRRETEDRLRQLAHNQGLRTGPFAVHVMETISQCPVDKFHAAMAEFSREAGKR